MTALHRLARLRPPWLHLLALPPGQSPQTILDPPATFAVRTIDGRACSTKQRWLLEAARVLSFPNYFDPNWDAFEDCLCDLEWLQAEGYLLLVDQADALLGAEPGERSTLFSILRSAGTYWSSQRPPKPFRTILVGNDPAGSIAQAHHIPKWKSA